MSKQRRAANKRDRDHPKTLNTVFQNLKGLVPVYKNKRGSISKIKILKIACKTIQCLTEMIHRNNRNDIDLICYPVAKTETLMENIDEDVEDIFSKHTESVKNINLTF